MAREKLTLIKATPGLGNQDDTISRKEVWADVHEVGVSMLEISVLNTCQFFDKHDIYIFVFLSFSDRFSVKNILLLSNHKSS